MADKTAIEWCDSTWNPLRARNKATGALGWHCEHVSEGCRNCYAEGFNLRLGTGLAFKPGHRKDIEIFIDDKLLHQPLKWKKPRRIFLESMSDSGADFVEEYMAAQMFAVMSVAQQHQFIVLTKRIKLLRERLQSAEFWEQVDCFADELAIECSDPLARRSDDYRAIARSGSPTEPLPNVWIGTSVEDQAAADERIPILMQTPAAKRFLSVEPMLGPINLRRIAFPEIEYETGIHYLDALRAGSWSAELLMRPSQPNEPQRFFTNHSDLRQIDWVIVGGESGPKARPMHPDWARKLRDQCAEFGTPFFFKQWGEWLPDRLLDNGMKRGVIMKVDGSRPADTDVSAMMGGTFDFAGYQHFSAVGKKTAGRLLDGVEHNGFPKEIAA